MSESPAKPRRRSLRFSLRGLFVVVTLLAFLSAWLGYQLHWIEQRKQARAWLAAQKESWYAPSLRGARSYATVPWSLRLLGEQGVVGIGLDGEQFANPAPYTRAQLQRLFPEARVDWSRDGRYAFDR